MASRILAAVAHSARSRFFNREKETTMHGTTTAKPSVVNGIDLQAFESIVASVTNAPATGIARITTTSEWQGQCRTIARTEMTVGGQALPDRDAVASDEPAELLGENTAPSPQDLLLAAVNACILVSFVEAAAAHGVSLRSVTMETRGTIDFRGLLGLDPSVKNGFERLDYTITVDADASAEALEEIRKEALGSSPNAYFTQNPIPLDGRVEQAAA
jgi:uncharacterized OsmC-like protein